MIKNKNKKIKYNAATVLNRGVFMRLINSMTLHLYFYIVWIEVGFLDWSTKWKPLIQGWKLRNTGNRSRDKKENQKETDKQKEKRLHCEKIEGQEIDSFFLH